MVVDHFGEAEYKGVRDGHSDANATFDNENSGHNRTPGITTDKITSTEIAQSNSKEDETSAEGKDENHGDVHHDIVNSAAGDIKKAASDTNNDQMDRKKPTEEQKQFSKHENKQQGQHNDPTERGLSTAVFEIFCCCCFGVIEGLLK